MNRSRPTRRPALAANAFALTLLLNAGTAAAASLPDIAGTHEPFAAHAIYFVMTDRFVNADPTNDQREQGGEHPSFDIPVQGAPPGEADNIGYLGGDFKGIVDNADYIRQLGFGAVWVTPIVDNPDEAFTGGDPVSWGSFLTDRGKTGYHGYWGVNFYRLDEHLPSAGLDFAGFTRAMHQHGLKVVLDIVCNHGSPSFTMPVAQAKFGQIFDASGTLVADHQNLPPEQLDPENQPLHRFFHTEKDLAQLSNLDDTSQTVFEYLTGAYLQWIDQGADAFRIDTVSHMPEAFWKRFSARIRTKHPGFFMFGEAFDYDANKIAQYTQPDSGALSLLDFPLKAQMSKVFGKEHGDYALLGAALGLDGSAFRNPYELVTFYDNHDMARLDATDAGFIDAHNWLFTARGIPAIYYGSEIGFMRGRAEHQGNRNYFGAERIRTAPSHTIYRHLQRIARLRAKTPALQQGVQVNIALKGERAAFYRVLRTGRQRQIALVLLNKGDDATNFDVPDPIAKSGRWKAVLDSRAVSVEKDGGLHVRVDAHDVQVYLLQGPLVPADFSAVLSRGPGTSGAINTR
ncbi:MAG: alpha-amylase family glycosyl hydrolase [Tahibacter sp.]